MSDRPNIGQASGHTYSHVRHLRWIVLTALLVIATGVAWGCWHPEIQVSPSPFRAHHSEVSLNTWSGCVREAAYASGVDPALIAAIVTVESGQHPYAFGWYDKKGVRRFYRASNYADALSRFDELEQQHVRFDVGLAQVNSRNLKVLYDRVGVAPIRALDACTNLRLAGLILREQITVHGPTWRAVAGYNGALAYVPKVHRVYCAQVPDAAGCDKTLPLKNLLCEPIPVAQTERYYRVFKTLL